MGSENHTKVGSQGGGVLSMSLDWADTVKPYEL